MGWKCFFVCFFCGCAATCVVSHVRVSPKWRVSRRQGQAGTIMGVAVRSGSVWVYFGLLRYPNVRCGSVRYAFHTSTSTLQPLHPSTLDPSIPGWRGGGVEGWRGGGVEGRGGGVEGLRGRGG